MTTAAGRFAAWAVALDLDAVPGPVRRAAARHLLDGLGCALGAAARDEAAPALSVARGFGGPAEATVVGSPERLGATAAAFANGVLVHALDFDDTHAAGLVHATSVVLPAVLALGEATGASGAGALAAAVAGYETVARLGAAVPHGFHERGFHATSVCGVFAAALVAAKLLGLDVARTVDALGIAGSAAAGSLEFLHTGSSTKQLHPGFAALNGITAARLAAAGASGPASILEGEYGLYRAYLGAEVDAARLTADLGRRWETERITIKPYAACQLSHAPLDALRSLLPIDPAHVEVMRFFLPAASLPIVAGPAAAKVRPRTPYEAKFSLPWSAAALVLDGDLTVDSFEAPARPDVCGLAARVECAASAFGGPPADAPGRVDVVLRDGTTRTGTVEASRGHPARPMSDADVLAKLRATARLDDRTAAALAHAVLELDAHASLEPVLRHLRGAAA